MCYPPISSHFLTPTMKMNGLNLRFLIRAMLRQKTAMRLSRDIKDEKKMRNKVKTNFFEESKSNFTELLFCILRDHGDKTDIYGDQTMIYLTEF